MTESTTKITKPTKKSKTTKTTKATKSDKSKSTPAPLDLSKMTPQEALAVRRADLLTAQRSLHDGTLENPHAIKAIKKDIARLLTKINQAKER